MMQSSLSFLVALLTIQSRNVSARKYHGFRHEAMDAAINPRANALQTLVLNFTITESCPLATPTHPSILSFVFPSPDAYPVEITSQSQVVTSYLPEMTWCVGAPMALLPMTGPPYLNQSGNYSTTIGSTGACETVYVPTATTVCATTLTGLASKVTVSECDQEITFSSERGFTLETPTATTNFSLITPAPTVRRMMTYWLAPWQSLTAGEAPSDVDIKICTILDDDGNMECIRYQEVWEVVVVTKTATSSREVQLTTTLSGPGTLIIETMEVYITDTIETVDLSTTLHLETEIETESTSRSKKLVTRPGDNTVQPNSTVYITKHVKYKSTGSNQTTTVRVTSTTTRTATITRTRARSDQATTVLVTSTAMQVGTITRTQIRPRPTFLELAPPQF